MLATIPNHVGQYSTPGTLFFCLFNRLVKTLQVYAVLYLFMESTDGLFHKITEWCIKYR